LASIVSIICTLSHFRWWNQTMTVADIDRIRGGVDVRFAIANPDKGE